MTYSFSNSVSIQPKVRFVLHILLIILFIVSACSSFKTSRKEKKPVQTTKSNYRIVKKENRYTQTHMIRQKANGFFVQFEEERRSVDMDIIISSMKVPYLHVSYYGTEPLSIPSGQTLTFNINGSEIKLSSKRKSNRLARRNEVVEVVSYLITRGQMKKIANGNKVMCSLHTYTFPVPDKMRTNWNDFIDMYWN